MATTRWEGKAVNVKQIATGVVANTWAQGDTVTITCDGLDFVITIGTLVTTAQVATTIKQAFEGETLTDTSASCVPPIADSGAKAIPQFREVTATVSSSTVTFTARTAGKPFTFSATESTAGTGTFTYTNAATASTGKHEADNADNFSAGAALTDNDVFIVDSGSVDIKYDLSVACQLATFRKTKAYTGNIGLPETNADDASYTYPEYRTKYFTTDDNSVTTTYYLEEGSGQGSGRVRLDAGAGQSVVNVYGKGTRAESNIPCIQFIGTHASNELNNFAGDVGVAFFGGESATIATLRNGDGEASAAETICGSGVTLSSATITVNGGTVTTNSAVATVNMTGGSYYHNSGNLTTINVDGGTFYPQAAGNTISTLRVGPNGTFDARKGTGSFTVTNAIQLYKGSKVYDPQGRGTYSGGFKLNRCTLADVTLVLASDKTYSLS